MNEVSVFERYIGIDYSGAKTATSSLKGLRIYSADNKLPPSEVGPPPSPRKYWSRRGVAEFLEARLLDGPPTIIGLDHGFSFPLQYFEAHQLRRSWPAFLDDFQKHWPTDGDDVYVDFVRDGAVGNGAARLGERTWRRLTERRAGGAKSVFHFDVQGSVAKSTHAGIPWLRYLRERVGPSLHFWPFDGWAIPEGASAIAEVYPSIWSRAFPREDRTSDQHDAYVVAAWMQDADRTGRLGDFLEGPASEEDRGTAAIEGWILGVR